ncbi:competence/damage-inducible protein A [Verticiella sediminum]|uniref:Competence/damage-inducible protein A n=1 Tax=Verticiella sediminum TaxID=1247510 RepID=A0A556A942_9BURK|nr:molybdopterin-binding protein [Verticiella sediminum]TSH89395.1 competence/damage-inducible protein A [Verticiella sediminum]
MQSNAKDRRIGVIVVGDEILSGRRQDQHVAKVIQLLGARGLQLAWAQIVGDDEDLLVQTYERSFASGDIVFSCGGIGATPDDKTRQAVAAALGLPLVLHPEAEALIAARCADMAAQGQGSADMSTPENRQRLLMGEFPEGSEIVANTYNRIPGFWIRDHTFAPGFPVMAWPMIEATLDTRYVALHHKTPRVEHSFVVYGLPESRITPALREVEQRWGVRSFSLPSMGSGGRAHIELGVKGDPVQAAEALQYLREQAARLGAEFSV